MVDKNPLDNNEQAAFAETPQNPDGAAPADGAQQPDADANQPPAVFRKEPPAAAAAGGAEAASPLTPRSTAVADTPVQQGDGMLPPAPRTVAEVGLSKAFLTDLTLKILHYSGSPTAAQLSRRLGLGTSVVQQIITALGEERLVEVMAQSDLYTGNYRYRLSERGRARVAEALERTRYAGPVPVTAEQYAEVIRKMHAQAQEPSRSRVKAVVEGLVLAPEVGDAVGRALSSGRAAILYGPSGNGKTILLQRFAENLAGFALMPYAIYAFGQVIRVFDPSVHVLVSDQLQTEEGDEGDYDQRWVAIRRPSIVMGAEMGAESLNLAYDPQAKFYQAPPHIKAQGGALIIDDFGRQQDVNTRQLLTRLLIPLERGWDLISLTSGEKLNVPFKAQLLFATNQPVNKLADESLLRRILYKVYIPAPTQSQFREILHGACLEKRVTVADDALDYVVQRLYSEPAIKPRGSYARDLIEMLVESASYDGREPVLDKKSFDEVFRLFAAHDVDNDGGEENLG
jgi:hypothetical protein